MVSLLGEGEGREGLLLSGFIGGHNFLTFLRGLGPVQTSNFTCAECNANEQNPLFHCYFQNFTVYPPLFEGDGSRVFANRCNA